MGKVADKHLLPLCSSPEELETETGNRHALLLASRRHAALRHAAETVKEVTPAY